MQHWYNKILKKNDYEILSETNLLFDSILNWWFSSKMFRLPVISNGGNSVASRGPLQKWKFSPNEQIFVYKQPTTIITINEI